MRFRVIIAASVFILVLAAVLRFANLNTLPVFADEAIYVRWSQVMRAEPSLRFLPLSDGKQPLFMWATIPLLKVVPDPLVAGRILSGLMGLGTVVGIGFSSWLLFKNWRLSLLSAGIWAILPYAVFFERLALADAMLAFFIVWAFALLTLALQRTSAGLAMCAGYCFGFAWLTKSPAIFGLALSPSLWLVSGQTFLSRRTLKSILLIVLSAVIAFAMYNVLRLGPEFHMIALRNQDYVHPLTQVLSHPHDPLIPHLKDVWDFLFYLLTPAGVVLLLLGLLDPRHHHLRPRLVLAAWFLLPILSQAFIAKTFTARYLFFSQPFAAILIAHALEHLASSSRRPVLLWVGVLLMAALSLNTNWLLLTHPEQAPLPRIERAGYLEQWTAGQGLREVSDYLRTAAQSGPVVVGSEGFFGTPFDALQLYLNDVKNVRIVGVGVWIDKVDEKLVNALDQNQVFLVVNSSRFHHPNPQDLGLKLIASYTKAAPPDQLAEQLLFFQVLPR